MGGGAIFRRLHLSLAVSVPEFLLPASIASTPPAICASPRCGESGVSGGLCGRAQGPPAGTCRGTARSVCCLPRGPVPLRLCLRVPASLGTEFWSLSPSWYLFGREGFVSTVTAPRTLGLGREPFDFVTPPPLPAWRWWRRETNVFGSWRDGPRLSRVARRLPSTGAEWCLGAGWEPPEGPDAGFGAQRLWTPRSWARRGHSDWQGWFFGIGWGRGCSHVTQESTVPPCPILPTSPSPSCTGMRAANLRGVSRDQRKGA